MESWKKTVLEFAESNDWVSAIEFSKNYINDHPENVDGYINIIYLLHHILAEEDYDDSAQEEMMKLLSMYFQDSLAKFIKNADYCFFVGKLLWASEWFFGINEGFNKYDQTLAYKLEKLAVQLEPDNELFLWSVKVTQNSPDAKILEGIIINGSNRYLNWLVSKGFAGKKLIEIHLPNTKIQKKIDALFMNSRKILYLNIIILIGILICHHFITEASKRKHIWIDIWIDILLLLLWLIQLLLNGYSISLLFKKLDKFIVIALFLSLCYYSLLLYRGSR